MIARETAEHERSIAYFCMEIGLDEHIRTYSGGLGVLAGDTLRSAADLNIPMMAVTLLYRQGHFRQVLDSDTGQREEPGTWAVAEYLEEMPDRITVPVEGRTVHLRCWKLDITGINGSTVPIYFLDADLEKNSEWDRNLTQSLYAGDAHYRLCQETILGIGGVRMLRALGHDHLRRFHLNEGHVALLTLELLDEVAHQAGRDSLEPDDIEAVRDQCVFTTHTPVPAGHDQFPVELARKVIGSRDDFFALKGVLHEDNILNMTYLALNFSHHVNGVAYKHKQVSQLMFDGYCIEAITNGVHAATWVSAPFGELFDHYLPLWRGDSYNLRYALSLPWAEVWDAHMRCKRHLLDRVEQETGVVMADDVLTIGFASRISNYKRPTLLFQDIDRLRRMSANSGGLQVIYAGKAHPSDEDGKQRIKEIFQAADALKEDIRIVYLEDYNIAIGALMTAGVDLWLNTPEPPKEASGTSGMKAALNGVPHFSVLDGWWIEGHIEGLTGWSIGQAVEGNARHRDHALDGSSLYDKLEQTILPLFYHDREGFTNVMIHAIAINGSFFNSQRMMQQYLLNAYGPL